ncbi:MAG: enoyl-CoA hydratase/isomerase family protein, partial [Hyphomicrobiales bacterium]
MPNLTIDVDGSGIALITWDMPGRSMNVIDEAVMDELEAIIARLKADPSIKGAIIASGKAHFSGGADLTMLSAYTERQGEPDDEKKRDLVFRLSRLSRLCRSLETCGKPVAAAINGTCLGGAFELTLACHYRVASEEARVGLPESKVGLLPGGGGTQR